MRASVDKPIDPADARRLVLERVGPLGTEDGFAVRAEDTDRASAEAPVTLTVTDQWRAGPPARSTLRRGEAIGISTGTVIPDGRTGSDSIEMELEEGAGAAGESSGGS